MQLTKYDFGNFALVFLFLFSFGVSGCTQSQNEVAPPEKPPKPVAVAPLRKTSPTIPQFITGSVVPWKSEQIGFEVAGRVVEVIEPNEFVAPQMGGEIARYASDATQLARLDDEQLRIAVESAQASVAVAKLNRDANQVTIEQQLPAQIESAKAEADLAELDLARTLKLSQRNATSRSELDAAQTRASTTKSRLSSSQAELAEAKARQLVLEAQVLQAQQQLSEAQRSLRNSILYSPFPGQISQIHAVPGTYVKEGDPVVTVQMMDPMTIEFEVTAHDSRRYRRGDILPVQVTDGSGNARRLSGMVYRVDTVADPAARTFTVTLHVRNEIDDSEHAALCADQSIAWTDKIMPLNIGPMITGNSRLLVVREAIHKIGGEAFVWKITNRQWGTPTMPGDDLLSVTKVPVQVTSEEIPYLGRWKFVAIEFTHPDVEVNVERDLITGRVYCKSGPSASSQSGTGDISTLNAWTGSQVLLDDQRWLLRSGDVVQILLSSDNPTDGFYVPMKVVREEQGQTFIHVIDDTESEPIARRVAVDVAEDDSVIGETVLLRITPTTPDSLVEGMKVVSEGTHYLNDGDRVMVSPVMGVQ